MCPVCSHASTFVRKDSDNISVFRFNLATGKLEWTGNESCRTRLSLPPVFSRSRPPPFPQVRGALPELRLQCGAASAAPSNPRLASRSCIGHRVAILW